MQLLMGQGSTNDGLVVITYQLPAQRPGKSGTGAPAAQLSAATAPGNRD
ncbi:hypothetical protein GCM10009547_49340 [Sporichthya brevicatena]|uniref:Uncharacterized protein n=1 Tax=Sporichthya brevicatena TaxID=171442 RepID=A0ABN1HDC5_9ACTN